MRILAFVLLLAPAVASAQSWPDSVRVIGYAQFRETWREHADLSATFPRVRLGVEGPLPSHLSYKFLVEYQAASAAGEAHVALRDAELRWKRAPWTVTAGQLHTPFSREYTMSPAAMETYDRSFVVEQLATRIDLGAMVEAGGEDRVSLTAGVFNGEGQNASGNRDSTLLFVARLKGTPHAGLRLGTSFAAYGGDSTRVGVDGAAAVGRLSLRAEWLAQHHEGKDSRDEGWYALAAVRTLPWLSVVGKRGELHRPSSPADRARQRETILGLMADFADGHARALLDGVERRDGPDATPVRSLLAQIQFKL